MPTVEFYYLIALGSTVLVMIYSLASYCAEDIGGGGFANQVLSTIPFVTGSLGILWPVAGLLLLCSFVFHDIAQSQGIAVAETSSFSKTVMTYTGFLTFLFGSPIVGYCIGRLAAGVRHNHS